jgi:hypothetical protein
MLEIKVKPVELWDEEKEEFVRFKGGKLVLEHSLVSIAKWEAKWMKPFLSSKEKTLEETIDYIRFMTVGKIEDERIYEYLSEENVSLINEYINHPMTATWFYEKEGGGRSGEVITNELVYYWMICFNIPFECQKWHFNRLLTLIRVCEEKNKPKKKMSGREIMERNRRLNEERRKKLGTKG